MEIINDRYELRSEIRRGGFGVTWYGWDKNLDMPVAIKEFSDPDPEHRKRFLREARTLAQFSGHRGIVNVRDFLQTDEKVYMVMEYLDGEDLSTYVDRKGRLSFDETMKLLSPVMDVLDKLHAANMLHRDVSPDNIRLTNSGDVKLLDFGSVSNMTSENLTRTITVKPGYAPIEQYSGAAEQGPWTDVYSLCATIYKCITGRKPADSLVRSFHDEVELPSALGAVISPEEEAVLMKGFSVRPGDRYLGISAFSEAMKEAGKEAGRREEKQKISELAEQAFSDDVTPASAPVSNTPVVPFPSGPQIPADAEDRPAPTAPWNTSEKEREKTSAEVQRKTPAKEQEKTPEAPAARKPFEYTSNDSAEGKDPSDKKKKKKGKGILLPVVLAGALIIALAAFIVKGGNIFGSGGFSIASGVPESADYTDGDRYITFSDAEITEKDIDFIISRPEIYSLYFTKCQLSDKIISRMPELTNIERIKFYYCDGYSSLNPLAQMPALKSIAVDEAVGGMESYPGDEFFTVDFPQQVEEFNLYCDEIKGSTDFLRHFPGLTNLTFYVTADGNDMSFLDAMPNLEILIIDHQTMDEEACSHLTGHPKLQFAHFMESRMATLEWVRECSELYELEAEDSLISDLTPLADHEALTTLGLSGAPVSDLAPLENCLNLVWLEIDHSKVESLAPLEGHNKLWYLDISHCNVSDLRPLSGAALETFKAAHNQISTLEPLAGCTGMKTIDVNGNELTDLDGCADMIKLTELNASNNRISDISAIRNCALLVTLRLSNNDITDISAINNNFADLTLLDISDNRIYDLSALAPCGKLSAIAAANNRISSLQGLEDKPDLTAVLISGNEVSDLSPLKGSLSKLSYLDIGSNNVSDISFLKDLAVKNIWLLMEKNEISDLSVLPSLLTYQEMIFYGNPIKDASFVKNMKNLGYGCNLYLTYDSELDYAAIGESEFKYHTFLVDVPADKKAAVLKSFKDGSGYSEPKFMTEEEADSEMAQKRQKIRKEIVGDSMDEEEESN